jgi:hypothetical protein
MPPGRISGRGGSSLVVGCGAYRLGRRNWSITQSRCTLVADRPHQQLGSVRAGRVADRPRLSSWSAGRGADLVCLRASGWRVCLGVPCRRWSGCRCGPCSPRGMSGAGCAWRWLVVRQRRGGWACLPRWGRAQRAHPSCRQHLFRTWACFGAMQPRSRGPPRLKGSRRRGFGLMRVGLKRQMDVEPPRAARPRAPGHLALMRARGRRHGPRVARWRCGRVGRAVIRDVAIRATPVRCPHKQNPNHATALHPTPRTT